MSWYVAIAGIIVIGVGHVIVAVSTIIAAVKGNQSLDATTKGALRAAAGLLGVSILISFIALILAMILMGTKGCSKKNKIAFLVFFLLFAALYITALTIIYIYWRRREKAGDAPGARDLRSAFIMPLVAIPLYIIGFLLIYFSIGRRLSRVGKMCKQMKQGSGAQF